MGEISDALARARDKDERIKPAEGVSDPDRTSGTAAPKASVEQDQSAPRRAPAPAPSADTVSAVQSLADTARAGAQAPTQARDAGAGDSGDFASLRSHLLGDQADEEGSHAPAAIESERTAAESEREAAPQAAARPSHHLPTDKTGNWVGRIGVVEPHGSTAVRFRHLAVRMQGLLDRLDRRSVLVTSPLAGEGKSTVSANLALALASVAPESRIGLIDLDLRRSCFRDVLGYTPKIGIEALLTGEAKLDDVAVTTDCHRLEFVPVYRTRTDAHQLIGRSGDRLFRQLHARYDYLVCDGPPVLPVPDIPLLAPFVGGCMAVVASGRSRHARLQEAMDMIPRKSMLGVFLNENSQAEDGQKYDYYRALDNDDEDDLESESRVDEVKS